MLLARALILVAAAAALLAGISTTRRTAGATVYVCPMHPDVAAAGPGECPICRMPLARRDEIATDLHRNVAVVRSRLMSREIIAPAWRDGSSRESSSRESSSIVSALLYDDEIAMLEPGQAAEFTSGLTRIAVRMTGARRSRWDGATSVVDFEARPDSRRDVRRGANRAKGVGWIQLVSPTRKVVTVPRAAILPSPAGPYLLVASADLRTVTRRPVHVGRTVAGHTTVVEGAREGERVVAADAFFVDAERRLAPAR